MRRLLYPIVLCALALALLPTGMVAAKGIPAEVTISGPGLIRTVVVTDTATLQALEMGVLEVFPSPVTAPPHAGPGYLLTRYYRDGAGLRPFDRVRYYPDLRPTGGPGYVFYVGIVDGSSNYDGHWFRLRPQSADVLQEILATRGIPPSSTTRCAATPLQVGPFSPHHPGLTDLPWIVAAPASAGLTAALFYATVPGTRFVRVGARGAAAALGIGGAMPDQASTKILWLVDSPNPGTMLQISGRNLTGRGQLRQTVPPALGGVQFPSIVDVPAPGCWQFTLRSGTVTATVTLLAVSYR